jgi:XTP/dITP diphosphohydrolase
VEGEILFQERGDGGFGYDSLFYYEPLGKTFAELEPEVKNRISHRASALAALQPELRGYLEPTVT